MDQSTKALALDFDGVITTEESRKRGAPFYDTARRVVNLWSGSTDEDRRNHELQKAALREFAKAVMDPELVARVNQITDATGAGILITSSWMRYADFETMCSILSEVGITGVIMAETAGIRFSGNTRCGSTMEWLRKHPNIDLFVVLDDESILWSFKGYKRGKIARGHLIHTLSYDPEGDIAIVEGITPSNVEEAISFLGRQG